MQYTLSIICLFLVFLFACQPEANKTQEAIARVGDAYCYPEDLGFKDETSPESASWNEEQVNTWINRQVWVKAADKPALKAEIEQLVQDYKESLLISFYQESLLAEANIKITAEEILTYYKENQVSFVLHNELYKIEYYLLNEEMDENALLKDLNNEEQNESLKQFCLSYPNKCLVEALWVERDVLETLELPTYMWNTTVNFQRFYRNDGSKGLFRIEGKKKVGDAEPLELVSNEIREILQFQKEKEIIKKHEEKLMLNAQNENSIEIY